MNTDQPPETNTDSVVPPPQAESSIPRRSRADIRSWLTAYLAFLLEEEPQSINTELSFDSHGIDSAAAVSLVGDLEEWMGIELDPTIVYDYPSVTQLADFLMTRQERSAA